jgi:hypothetical protein
MTLTPTAPRAVIDDDSAASILMSPTVPRDSIGWWPMVLLSAALAVCVLLYADARRWKARTREAEGVFQQLLQQSSPDVKLSLLRALEGMDTLSPRTEKSLIELMKSEDQQIRLAVVNLMLLKPETARAATGDLARLSREDSETPIRNRALEAIEAGKNVSSGRSWLSMLLSWLIPLLLLGMLAAAANYGWKWAKSHALIPGL